MPLTLAQIKDAIILNSKSVEICDTLHDAQISATEDELIAAGLPLVVYTYQTGIVDDALLAEFTEAKLNAAGIYTTGTFTITNPVDEVYIMKSAIVTLTVNGDNKAKVSCMGAADVTIVANDNAYIEVKVYNAASVDLTINNDAIVNLTSSHTGDVTINQNDDSIFHANGTDQSTFNLTGNDQSNSVVKMYNNSLLNYLMLDTAVTDAKAFQEAIITNIAP